MVAGVQGVAGRNAIVGAIVTAPSVSAPPWTIEHDAHGREELARSFAQVGSTR